MKNLITLSFAFLLSTLIAYGQLDRIEKTIDPLEAESHLRFLTSNELKGRDTGSEELLIAGRYIAEQFRRSGVTPLGDAEDDYLQRVPLLNTTAASDATVDMVGQQFKLNADLLVVSGSNTKISADLIYLEKLDDYKSTDVSGKVIVTVLGDNGFNVSGKSLQDAGAVGLVQIYRPGWRYPWPLIANYLNRSKMALGSSEKEEGLLPHIWINDTAKVYVNRIKESSDKAIEMEIKGISEDPVKAFNIVGKIEGTDPKLKNQHIVMTAHYDHVGIQKSQDPDSIYNGTRDNGIGTTGVINAAKYFGKNPPKRSIIFIALTGEEKGLLGSSYYVDNPKIPLEETVMNLNIDNSGYTDTEYITLLDSNRTNIDEMIYQAAEEVGLKVMGDRIPDQNYYERSDQVSFAKKGVPAINFKMSMEAFDERISKYYHRPSDEFHTVDLEYIHKYWKAYIRAAELIGNWKKTPYWIEGDKFESAGDELYGKN